MRRSRGDQEFFVHGVSRQVRNNFFVTGHILSNLGDEGEEDKEEKRNIKRYYIPKLKSLCSDSFFNSISS